MHKKLSSILLVVALVGGLLAAGITPAWAENPPASFLPDDDGAGGASGSVLSDRFDGVDNEAHLTAVTQSGIERVEWYHCPGSSGDDNTITQAELGACTQMGVDSTPNQPVPGTTFVAADLAWDITFNFTTALDNQVLTVAVIGCVGAGTDVEGTGQNCQQSVEDDITFDDAETGEPDTTTAEITQLCTADTGGPTIFTDLCEAGGTGQGTAERAVIDARFTDFEHGDPVPNEGFTFRARSSADLVLTDLTAHIDEGADANLDPTDADASDVCAVIETFSTFKTWECQFTDAQLDDNAELALWVQNSTGGTGFCTTPCVLDSHYHVAVERAAVEAEKSFDPEFGSPSPPDISSQAGCEDGETPDREHSTNDLSETFGEEGCLEDQFNDEFNGPVTVESDGVGALVCLEETTEHDHDDDGLIDHCHGSTGGDGVFNWAINNPNGDPGDQNITFCLDEENGGTDQAPPANHGCADETVTDSNVMHWATQAEFVFLAYTEPAPGDPNDPCRTGQTFKTNRVGDREGLIACTFDGEGNPISTEPGGAEGGFLRWTITTTPGGERTAVRFTADPPTETTGPNGQATTEIEAFREDSNFIIVELLDSNGVVIAEARVEKRVEGRRRGRGPRCDITGTNGPDRLRGTRRGELICARGGRDRVRARGGADEVRGGRGRDVLRGGRGPDLIKGGPGFDRCIGGPGRDRFRSCEVRRQ